MAAFPNISCPIARECGCCSQLQVPYAQQLAQKQRRMQELFEPLLVPGARVEPIAGMEHPAGYRNKIASPFAPDRPTRPARPADRDRSSRRSGSAPRPGAPGVRCGMYAAGTHRIVACDACPVEHPAGRRVIAEVRRLMLRHGMPAYDEDAGSGLVRHVVVRVGHASGEVLVTIVTNGEFPQGRSFARQLVRRCPDVTTVVNNVNTASTNAILGRREQVLFGPGFILDQLCGLSFRISSRSFYQVNAVQTEVLYRAAVELAALEPGQAVLDAYCGTGTIGLVAAASAPGVQVTGVDNVESAIEDARGNARHNGIGNARFACDDAGSFMQRMAASGQAVDVLLLDPPRAGASEAFLRAAGVLMPKHIVYISCNPDTQARDVSELARAGYALRGVRPVDMFPHTPHVETVALLARGRDA